MKAGAIVLTIIPWDNQQKTRPVLILKVLPKYNDFPVCAISSQLHQLIPNFDLIINDDHPAFSATGLRTSSLQTHSSLPLRYAQHPSPLVERGRGEENGGHREHRVFPP